MLAGDTANPASADRPRIVPARLFPPKCDLISQIDPMTEKWDHTRIIFLTVTIVSLDVVLFWRAVILLKEINCEH